MRRWSGLGSGFRFVVVAGDLLAVEDEAEFAGMVGHAMGHAALRHGLGAGYSDGSMPVIYIGPHGDSALYPAGMRGRIAAWELEADRYAVEAGLRNGYEGAGLGRYWGVSFCGCGRWCGGRLVSDIVRLDSVLWREAQVLTMQLSIEIPDELASILIAKAAVRGVSPDSFASTVLQGSLIAEAETPTAGEPFVTGYGMWAKYGPAPSAEEIDENRRDMFRNFAKDH